MTKPMYSVDWFETFAATVPTSIVNTEIEALVGMLPMPHYRRVLDVACGIGRISGPLSGRGYAVTGLDISVDALRAAKGNAPLADFVALDQQHVGRMSWQFDGGCGANDAATKSATRAALWMKFSSMCTSPAQLRELCLHAGLEATTEMAWWDPSKSPSADSPRYQVICERPSE